MHPFVFSFLYKQMRYFTFRQNMRLESHLTYIAMAIYAKELYLYICFAIICYVTLRYLTLVCFVTCMLRYGGHVLLHYTSSSLF